MPDLKPETARFDSEFDTIRTYISHLCIYISQLKRGTAQHLMRNNVAGAHAKAEPSIA